MHNPPNAGVAGVKAQHLNGLGAQKRNRGDIRLGVESRLKEVSTQVRAHLGQCLGHSASGGGGTAS